DEPAVATRVQRTEIETVAAADVENGLVAVQLREVERGPPDVGDRTLERVDRLARREVAVVAVLLGDVTAAARVGQVSCSSSFLSASSSERFSAKLSSDTSTLRALTSIAFSPADRPFVASRSARFRTTSATWYTSPLFNFSWWFLNRRLQLVGSRTSFLPSSWNRSSTSSAVIGGRMPTSSTLSVGTESVMSPCAIFKMRYSRFSPATSIISFFS